MLRIASYFSKALWLYLFSSIPELRNAFSQLIIFETVTDKKIKRARTVKGRNLYTHCKKS